MDMPVNVPVDDPNADTEWNDILRKHGIIPEKPKDPEPVIQEALIAAKLREHDNRLEDKTLDELDELEDEEDDAFLEQYRQKRLAELGELAKKGKFGTVLPLQKAEWEREVTEASKESWVIVALTSSEGGNVESRVLSQLLPQLASKYPDVKILSVPAPLAIPNYPERNTPTLLFYHKTNVAHQTVTLAGLNGVKTSLRNLELLLMEVGCVKEGDMRLKATDEDADAAAEDKRRGIRSGGKGRGVGQDDEDDDPWD